MRIAFVSCVFTALYPDQPVWGWIAAQQPDRLVLLGDSTYFDIDSASHPRDMHDWAFAQHLYQRYAELIAQPQFAALVGAMPPGTVHAIWDDHDFLWNDATGGDRNMRVVHGGKIRLATAFLEAFRAALQQQLAAGQLSARAGDAVVLEHEPAAADDAEPAARARPVAAPERRPHPPHAHVPRGRSRSARSSATRRRPRSRRRSPTHPRPCTCGRAARRWPAISATRRTWSG